MYIACFLRSKARVRQPIFGELSSEDSPRTHNHHENRKQIFIVYIVEEEDNNRALTVNNYEDLQLEIYSGI